MVAMSDVAERLRGREAPDRLVCSGLLEAEADGVSAAFADAGLGERERRVAGDWAAISFAGRWICCSISCESMSWM